MINDSHLFPCSLYEWYRSHTLNSLHIDNLIHFLQQLIEILESNRLLEKFIVLLLLPRAESMPQEMVHIDELRGQEDKEAEKKEGEEVPTVPRAAVFLEQQCLVHACLDVGHW